ncbi:MAG: hypothetical protein ACLP59_03950 [Bryobacteraceae bacterium]
MYTGESAAVSRTPLSSPDEEWTYTMLHYFGENHANVWLHIARDSSGNLYGIYPTGGVNSGGAVYEIQGAAAAP